MSWVTKDWTAEEVVDAKSLASFVQQELGTPYPSVRQMKALNTELVTFWKRNPMATWQTLARVTLWTKSKRRHPALVHQILQDVRYAWSDGWLPELMPSENVDREVEAGIERALAIETDPGWRRVLLGATGVRSRREVLAQWTAR